MPEFNRKIDKKIDDEIARLDEWQPQSESERMHKELEMAVYKHLKKWNEDNY